MFLPKVTALACGVSLAMAASAYAQTVTVVEDGSPKTMKLTKSGMDLVMKHSKKLPARTFIIQNGSNFYAMADRKMSDGRMLSEWLMDRSKGNIE